jgi:hypothetical protein
MHKVLRAAILTRFLLRVFVCSFTRFVYGAVDGYRVSLNWVYTPRTHSPGD